jgi:hypothetical protein
MTPQHLVVNGNSSNAWGCLEKGHNIGIKNMLKRIRATAVTRRFALRRKSRFLLNAVSGRPADRRLGGGDFNGVGLSLLHKKPHLMIGCMATRHKGDSPFSENHPSYRADRDHETLKNARRRGCNSGRATPSRRYTPAAESHPD